jgi:DNA-binding transcriptional ArsR family regulator
VWAGPEPVAGLAILLLGAIRALLGSSVSGNLLNVTTHHAALQALADPTRRAVFERLRGGPLPVGRLAEGLHVSRPAVSQHLRVLRDARLVTERRVGTRRIYRIEPDGLAELRSYLDAFWGDALESFKAFTESQEESTHADRARSRARRTGAKVRDGRPSRR